MAQTTMTGTQIKGVSPAALALRAELIGGAMEELAAFPLGAERDIAVMRGGDALWGIIRRNAGKAGVALRLCHAPGGIAALHRRRAAPDETLVLEADTVLGRQRITLSMPGTGLPILRATLRLTPALPLLVPFLSRDVYPLGEDGDLLSAAGRVEAAQRGLNSGLSYFHLDSGGFGSVLYFQNLTALNDYFAATGTTPDTAVGGEWPEIGYLAPAPPQSGTPPTQPLPAGREVVMSDALLAFHDDVAADERDTALRFLQLQAAIYRVIDRPGTEFRDWPARAARTLRDLEQAPEATISHYGNRYIHPYTASEYPDIMVQMVTLSALRDWSAWTQAPVPLEAELARGLHKFRDRTLGTMRRYLPNVGKDKDADAVDSWYLYHPLLMLGRIALDGDRRAKRLFLSSLDYAVRAAHHFDYCWPIQFKVDDFSVITEARNDDGLGQTDVGGLYAYVMLQAFELTGEHRFLIEARASIDAAKSMRFELNYQANLTAWGAVACLRLWRITTDRDYLRQSYIYLANFFHNSAIWESEIAFARHYSNFLGVTCLHDGPYMAIYECFDSFAAFEFYLKDGGPELDPAARMLVAQYCKYALHRAWYYYPDALPAEILAEKVRNGRIDRALSFPLEDLYHDGQPAGQVGQEIYGSGAAFVFASRAFHRIEGAPFQIFCDHFVLHSERQGANRVTLRIEGGEGCDARLALVRLPRATLPKATVATMGGDRVRARHHDGERVDYVVPATGLVTISWD